MINIKKIQNKNFESIPIDPFWNTGTEKELKMHRIHAYPARFPSFITTKALEYADRSNHKVDSIADVFCGCGTTAFESRRNNIEFWGCDINPASDTIPDRSINNSTLDDVQLYLLKGSELSDSQAKNAFNKKYGQFSEIDYQSIIFPLYDGKALGFRFKKLDIRSWRDLKVNRIGRLLPPYINRIQQRYALYLQRRGLPRTPDKAVLKK